MTTYVRGRQRVLRRRKLIAAALVLPTVLPACSDPPPPQAVPVLPDPEAPRPEWKAPTAKAAAKEKPEPSHKAEPTLRAVEPLPADDVAGISPTWLALVDCESSMRWHYRGLHHGGPQFSPATYTAFRLRGYPKYAWQATPRQQIEVAKRVLRSGGVSQWPSCGPRVGLSMKDAA